MPGYVQAKFVPTTETEGNSKGKLDDAFFVTDPAGLIPGWMLERDQAGKKTSRKTEVTNLIKEVESLQVVLNEQPFNSNGTGPFRLVFRLAQAGREDKRPKEWELQDDNSLVIYFSKEKILKLFDEEDDLTQVIESFFSMRPNGANHVVRVTILFYFIFYVYFLFSFYFSYFLQRLLLLLLLLSVGFFFDFLFREEIKNVNFHCSHGLSQ